MVIIKANKDSEAGKMPSERLFTAMTQFNEELVKAGIMLSGEGLQPSNKGVRVQFAGDKRTVVDGPFSESKELVAGFWIWQVKSLDEAIAWAKRIPNTDAQPGEVGEIELRPVYENEDLGETFTPELRAKEELLRAEIARQHG
jgi:hypothetical protein